MEQEHSRALKLERDRRAGKAYRLRQLARDPAAYKAKRAAANKRWREKHNIAERERHRDVPIERKLLYQAKHRARKDGVPFALALSDIVIPTHCPVLGIPLSCGNGTATYGSPTLDRFHPALGYVPGNVTVISFRANTLKNDASLAEMELIVRWMRSR